MKTLAFFTLILIGIFGVITAIARPDVIQKQYAEISAPIAQYFAEKNARAWKEAKDSERALWLLKLHMPADCTAPKTAIRDMECRNSMQIHAQAFEQNWANKVQSGWKPDGVSK